MIAEKTRRAELGMGIYTIPDIAVLLGLPTHKVNRWINTFWDEKLGKEYQTQYTWNVAFTKAVNFYTLIELYTFYQLSEAGVKPKKILEAHKSLTSHFKTNYPFAKQNIINGLRTEGSKVLFQISDGEIISLDKKKQYHFEFIKIFFKKLDFDKSNLVTRLWPLGKSHSIVCDPHHQFGQPVISGTNILAEFVADMHAAGDSIDFISRTYNLKHSQIRDAIRYASQAA